ncbi:MAG TPA: IS481 family transposase [bacterium]|nr:IS481 family transposase [bacterium]
MTLEDSVRYHRLMLMQRAAQLGNVTRACQEAGISRTLFYRWRQRLLRYGPEGLRPRPTRPTRWPRQATPALEHAVLAYALLRPTHGPARIAAQLRQPRWGRWRVSASGVYGIRTRQGLQTRWQRLTRLEAQAVGAHGLLTERTCRRLVHPHVDAQRPGALVCMDACYVGKLKGVGKVWQLTACDAACSYAIATLVPRVTQATATAFLRTHVMPTYPRGGHQVRAVLTDGGPEFYGRFLTGCRELGIEHRRTKPRHAWTNGFVERLQGTILSELWRSAFRRTYYTSRAQLERDLQAYLRFYNRERPHQGYRLQGRTPATLFASRKVS